MNLDERLGDLCQQGQRTHAESLAKAALTNEPVKEVVIDDAQVHVETPRFRGVHQLTTDRTGDVDVRSQGEYTYTNGAVELSFSTATMNQRAYDRAQDALAVRNGTNPQATDADPPLDDNHPFPEDSSLADPDTIVTSPDRPVTSPVAFLKGLL